MTPRNHKNHKQRARSCSQFLCSNREKERCGKKSLKKDWEFGRNAGVTLWLSAEGEFGIQIYRCASYISNCFAATLRLSQICNSSDRSSVFFKRDETSHSSQSSPPIATRMRRNPRSISSFLPVKSKRTVRNSPSLV